MIDHWSSQVSPVRIMRLSPFTLSTHNCFIHAVIVTYSDFAINIHTSLFLSSWHGPCVQPIPDHSLEHETITSHSMYWLLWFPAVYLIRPRYKCYWYTSLLLLRVLTMMELLIQATPDHIPPALTTDPTSLHQSDVLTICCTLETLGTLWLSIMATFQYASSILLTITDIIPQCLNWMNAPSLDWINTPFDASTSMLYIWHVRFLMVWTLHNYHFGYLTGTAR